MNAADLKIKIFRQVDSLDNAKLEELYGVMLNFINSKKDSDEWIGVNVEEVKGIEAAITEFAEGKGIPNDQVISNLRKKYSNG